MVPLNISADICHKLCQLYGVESLLLTYLGLPMDTTKPMVEHLISMVCKVGRNASWYIQYDMLSSRLVLIKTIVTAMLNFDMCAMKVHYNILDHFEKYGTDFI
jgi:hypothetical protein